LYRYDTRSRYRGARARVRSTRAADHSSWRLCAREEMPCRACSWQLIAGPSRLCQPREPQRLNAGTARVPGAAAVCRRRHAPRGRKRAWTRDSSDVSAHTESRTEQSRRKKAVARRWATSRTDDAPRSLQEVITHRRESRERILYTVLHLRCTQLATKIPPGDATSRDALSLRVRTGSGGTWTTLGCASWRRRPAPGASAREIAPTVHSVAPGR
jgi:hypothetical protein